MEASNWPSVVFRAFGLANLVLAALGGFFLIFTVFPGGIAKADAAEQPYFVPFFWAMTAVNVCFLAALVVSGIRLLQLKIIGVVICNLLFVAEIVYFFFFIGLLWSSAFSERVSMSAAGATGVGNMALAPQLISAYPVLGLVCLNLARWRRRRESRQMEATGGPQG
jgi:fatty acid desaturase